MRGQKEVTTPEGLVEIPIQSSINLPLNTTYYKIEKQVLSRVDENQTEFITTIVPPDIQIIIAEVILGCICFVICILLGVFVTDLDNVEKYKRILNSILREHGSRLVSIAGIDTTSLSSFYKLSNIEDLVKVADELELPIMYKKKEDMPQGMDTFYIVHDRTLYSYEVSMTALEEKKAKKLMLKEEEYMKKQGAKAEKKERKIANKAAKYKGEEDDDLKNQ